jgi:putative nucleotidyltransferase with HDIG domain
MQAPLATCATSDDLSGPLAQRAHPEPDHAYRSPFERDRARVIHARAFRRLAGKTQVFSGAGDAGEPSDHFRSRLTHTMEVAQIARTIAQALGLNQNLTETLALVHDIGHPPFGHAGERALDACLQEHGLRFDHNLHALRIVEDFELRYAAFRGLNLFNEALKRMLNALVGDLLDETVRQVEHAGAWSLDAVRHAGRRLVSFSPEMEQARLDAKRYLYTHLYDSEALARDHSMADAVVRDLFHLWVANPSLLPASYQARIRDHGGEESAARVTSDYIAGMTDGFILQQHLAFRAFLV